MEERILDQAAPPPPKVRGNILRLKSGQTFTFLVNSSVPWHATIHWCGRSLPHLKDASKCVGCQRGFATREVYYLHVFTYERKAWEFLELPVGAARDLESLIGRGVTYKGTRVKITRKKGDKAHLVLDVQTHNQVMQPGYEYPQEEDPEKLLRYLWGMNNTRLKLADTSDLEQGKAS